MNPLDVGSDPNDYALSPRPRRNGGTDAPEDRPVCRVVPLKPEPGLALALARLLAKHVPEIRFATNETEPADWVWACGYERDHFEQVVALRGAHPGSRLLVTGRRLAPILRGDLARAGVDLVLEWPQPLRELRQRLAAAH